jgi:hypothetical protein
MKDQRFSRRDFFKLSAFGAGALALSTVVGPAPEHAHAQPVGPLADATPPGFALMPSALAFGAPADISMGWDGTVWAIGDDGAPHTFDAIANTWQPHGDGIDAVALVGDLVYHFRGSQYVTVNYGVNTTNAVQNIADTWPNLPNSFKLGVHGAANVGGALYLFKGGLYVNASAAQTTTLKLTNLTGWPQTANWKDGAIDAVMSDGSTVVFLFRGNEYVPVDMNSRRVLAQNPAPITNFVPWQGRLPADWAANGIDAAIAFGGNDSNYTISQVAVGDASRVWVRESGSVGNVRRFVGNAISDPVAEVGQAAHIAANADGTLWHCAETANAFRFISEGSDPTEAIPVPADAQATVQCVASTGFGNGYCLVQPGGALGAQAGRPPQLYAYDSNYAFKTSQSYDTISYGQIEQGLGNVYFIVSNTVPGGQQYAVVALDQLTGRERWAKPSVVSPVNVWCAVVLWRSHLRRAHVRHRAGAGRQSIGQDCPGQVVCSRRGSRDIRFHWHAYAADVERQRIFLRLGV